MNKLIGNNVSHTKAFFDFLFLKVQKVLRGSWLLCLFWDSFWWSFYKIMFIGDYDANIEMILQNILKKTTTRVEIR